MGVLTTIVTLGAVQAPGAAADGPPQYCSINISTGASWCSDTDPTLSGQMVRRAVDGVGSILLGRFFDDTSRDATDGFFNVYASAGCDTSPDLDYTLGTVPSGWNDRVSSFQGYSSCSVRLWRNGNATGSYWGPAVAADAVGAVDNQASSMTFY